MNLAKKLKSAVKKALEPGNRAHLGAAVMTGQASFSLYRGIKTGDVEDYALSVFGAVCALSIELIRYTNKARKENKEIYRRFLDETKSIRDVEEEYSEHQRLIDESSPDFYD